MRNNCGRDEHSPLLFHPSSTTSLTNTTTISSYHTAATSPSTPHIMDGESSSSDNNLKSSGHGINILTACLFIVGEIAGTGILAFPFSFIGTGWWGVAVIALGGLGGGYAGVVLGKSWLIVENNLIAEPPHDVNSNREGDGEEDKTRDPYSLIGFYAFGKHGRTVTTVTLMLFLFGSSVVQMLVCAETLHSLIHIEWLNFCRWIVLVGLILLPVSFLGSPVDFWPIAFFAMSSTSVACVLIIVSIFMEKDPADEIPITPAPDIGGITLKSFLLGISTVMFGYGGASCLPTIQNDMKDKRKFTTSVVMAFAIMLAMYLPVSAAGYWKFGPYVKSNIMRNLTPTTLTTIINILITAHVCCGYLIQINPVNLTLESMWGIHHSFNSKRCLSRFLVTFLAVLTGLTIPKFGKLLNFLGAFAVSLQSFILPAVFYLKLCPPHQMTIVKKVVLLTIAVFGLFIAIVSTIYSLIELMSPNSFTLPCWINDCVDVLN